MLYVTANFNKERWSGCAWPDHVILSHLGISSQKETCQRETLAGLEENKKHCYEMLAFGNHMSRNCNHPPDTERSLQLTASKKLGISVLDLQGTKLFEQLQWVWKWTLQHNIQKGSIPANTYIATLWDSAENPHTVPGHMTYRTVKQ